MCTIVLLLRPGHAWPVLFAANRDEMATRPWRPPGRHWPDRAHVIAGRDELGQGSWLGLNEAGVVAAVLNRINTLGPAPGLRSRGELPLEALDHASAADAAQALADLEPAAYRPFNLVVADASAAFCVRATAADGAAARGGADAIVVDALPPGLSMITAYDRNDRTSPRIRRFLPRFAAAAVPDPQQDDWRDWMALLADRTSEDGAGPGGAMTVAMPSGFGTSSSSLIALPAAGDRHRRPVWLFAAGAPDRAPFAPLPV
jgi:hypothetical protein